MKDLGRSVDEIQMSGKVSERAGTFLQMSEELWRMSEKLLPLPQAGGFFYPADGLKGGEGMTRTEENMYPSVRRNLRVRYPSFEGWKIYLKDRRKGYEPDFVVERRIPEKIERVVVEVKATCKVYQKDVDQLNRYVRNLSGRNSIIANKILVVASSVDTSVVPSNIEVMYLRNFKCED